MKIQQHENATRKITKDRQCNKQTKETKVKKTKLKDIASLVFLSAQENHS